MTTTETWQHAISDWIVENYRRRHGGDPGPIDLDTDIIESRILDSLSIMNFVAFLEELVERDIDIAKIDIDNMRTIRRISDGVLGEVA